LYSKLCHGIISDLTVEIEQGAVRIPGHNKHFDKLTEMTSQNMTTTSVQLLHHRDTNRHRETDKKTDSRTDTETDGKTD